MSLFASVALVCTLSYCSDYVLDTAETRVDAMHNTTAVDNEFLSIWGDENMLNMWLTKYHVGETVFEIVSIDFETVEIPEKEIP